MGLETTLQTLAIPAVAVVMLLALVAFIARILLDPLAALAQSARQISGGNFDVSSRRRRATRSARWSARSAR